MYAPQPTSTNIRDRTLEFHQCVSSFNKRVNRGQQAQTQAVVPVKKSEFQLRASDIAKDIAHVSELLAKLAMLVKKKPMFDDRPQEIAELSYVIKQEMVKIERNLKNLQSYTQTGSIPNDELKSNSKNVVQLLNTKMKNVSGNFKEVLETRQKAEMETKSRKEKFFSTIQNSSTGPVVQPTTSDNPFLMDAGSDNPNAALLQLPQDQQLQLLEEQTGEYLRDRSTAVETIESTIQEVGGLFQQLATLVSEQSETIQRIDTNVQDIDMNVMGAQRELLKYFNSISNNRWLYLKIFGVMLMFFVLWIMVN